MDKLAETLAHFAEKVGIEVVRLWPAMIRVYWGQELIDRMLWTLVIPAFTVATVRIYRTAARRKGDAVDNIGWWLAFWVALIITVVCGLVWIGTLPHALSAIFSPEATFVLDKVKP